MKVAINGGSDKGHSVRGIGVHTREIAKHLKALAKKDNKTKIATVDFTSVDLSNYDVVHFPYFNPFLETLPRQKPADRVVLTIHDLIPLLYPDHYPPGIRGRRRFREQKKRLEYIDRIITISETSKKDICRLLKIGPKKVEVVYLAPQSGIKRIKSKKKLDSVRKKYDLPSNFVLYVGDVNYNKNVPNLLEACARAELSLVIVGKHAKQVADGDIGGQAKKGPRDIIRGIIGKEHPETRHFKKISRLLNSGSVKVLGFLPGNDFSAVFSMADVYCQPSFYEGFGLPLLEAMSFGVPVAASRTQALVEIAGPAALYFDPNDPDDMSKVLMGIMEDAGLKNELAEEGSKRTKLFSWKETAEQYLDIYRSVFGSRNLR